MDFKTRHEYMKWLSFKLRRKFGNKTYNLYTDGTAAEVNEVSKKLKGYKQVFAVETFKASDGTTHEVHLLYVVRDEEELSNFRKKLSERLT